MAESGECTDNMHRTQPPPFEDSRRLTGPNLYFAEPGAVLETLGERADDPDLLADWRTRVQRGRVALGWPDGPIVVRRHRGGAGLAFSAPVDQLFCATELNEWAWLSARGEANACAPGYPASHDEADAMQTLRRYAAAETQPALIALLAASRQRQVPALFDDEQLTLGLGHGSRSWPLSALPEMSAVPWSQLHGIPVALVTGSNGKTTTVRLLAALLRAHGLRAAHSCTDGVFVGDEALLAGDYSGPAGARAVLRHPQVEAAVLETARGGLLRRGLAIEHADVAIVTNISADHFGEYGIDDLDGLAEAKLVVARALDDSGVLVLNADDAALCAHAAGFNRRIAWFALDDLHPRLQAQRERGGHTCGAHAGRLWLSHGAQRIDLGAVAQMPLTADGHARYNLANIAGAVLLADALGVGEHTLRTVLAHFGGDRRDNPGRLERWQFGGIRVLMDYAHNPDGLRSLLEIAAALRGEGRLALLLGQAGNRGDADIRALAATAAAFAPELVVLKDLDGYLRGRAVGEVATLLRTELIACGLPEAALPMTVRELDAARQALAWARPGDVLVLPVHALGAKLDVAKLLETLQASGWQAGHTLPAP